MKLKAGLVALTLAFGSSAFAADIYVRNAMGSDLSSSQVSRITQEVKRAVTKNGQNTLAQSESDADFVLQPSIVQRGDQMVLRVEREKDGEVLAMSEQPLSSSDIQASDASHVTDIALQNGESNDAGTDDQSGSLSGATSSSDTMANTNTQDYPAKENTGSYQQNSQSNYNANGSAVSGSTVSGTDMNATDNSMNNSTANSSTVNDASSGMASADAPKLNRDATSGDIRAPSPRVLNQDRPGYFQIGLGNSFGLGLETDEVMYNINAGYNYNLSQMFTLKGLIDANLGTGAEDARFIDLAVGGEFYPEQNLFNWGAPYLGADVGFAFVRDGNDKTEDAPALGANAGFKFQALQLNWDLAVRYTYLTGEIDDTHPSIFGGHVAVNF
jgi:hypothetical protein